MPRFHITSTLRTHETGLLTGQPTGVSWEHTSEGNVTAKDAREAEAKARDRDAGCEIVRVDVEPYQNWLRRVHSMTV
jgi:hypothetical protein